MSAAMLKQMMEDAGAFLKDEKYQQALDAARRVSQFDANNFQALMCVGLACFHLKQWEDSENALRRAAELKPDLPAAWKNLVDLFDATGDVKKKIEVLEKLIGVFRKGNKIKPSQKWIAELATAAASIKLYGKAFDAWYTLVDETQELSVDATPNDELPSSLVIWLQLMDVLQLPNFSLSEATGASVSMDTLMDQFVAAAQRWPWHADAASSESESLRTKTDIALAMFLRIQLDHAKAAKSKAKQSALTKLDAFTASLVEWFPSAKLPVEYLLLRSEDQDSPIDANTAHTIAARLCETFAKSPMSLMFQGFAVLESDPVKARELLVEGLASCSASSFHESSLCVRAQMALASLALDARDVEGCLSRLQKAQDVALEKTSVFGCAPPTRAVYSDVKVQLLQARAHDLAGAFEKALNAYQCVVAAARSSGDAEALAEASTGAAELLCSKNRAREALELLDSAIAQSELFNASLLSALQCSRAWATYLLGDAESAKSLLEGNLAKLLNVSQRARALKRMAIVYWHLGGTHRTDKTACFGSLLQAAKLAPRDGEIFAWLGKWYNDIGGDVLRAEKCFLKALALAPLNEMAGLALSELYEKQSKTELNVKLWHDLTAAPESAPTWALLRLAQHLVNHDDETAVSKLHLVLRNEPLNATYWVAMGHVYRHFGKLVAAQRSYLRAIELGETGWCVLTELARIEGSLLLFDDALVRIDSALQETNNSEAPTEIISTVYAELLFEQAKFLNGEGLYGRAAANIQKAAELLASVRATVPTLKLLGDLHSFAFYLSPLQFQDGGWIDFLSRGRRAYEQLVALLPTDATAATALAQAHYDVGVSCWYEARALYSTHGKRFNAFGTNTESLDVAVDRLQAARKHLRVALRYDASYGLAWNALGVVLEHPLAKQFAWVRAIQTTNSDVAWANLGMLYVHNRSGDGNDSSRTAELARNAFLHLQAINTNNPAMWIGYGLLYLGQRNARERRKAREAFQCALEMGNHLDALQGFVLSAVSTTNERDEEDEDADAPSHEQLLFAIQKYLEREAYDANAWSVLSVVQFQLGLIDQAVKSSAKSLELLHGESSGGVVERNHAILSAVQRIATDPSSSDAAFASVLQQLSGPSIRCSMLDAQRSYYASDKLTALQTAQSALEETVRSSQSQRHVGEIAGFALALSALTVSTHRAQATQLANVALAAVVDRAASGKATSGELAGAEAFHRMNGSLDAFASTFQLFTTLGSSSSSHHHQQQQQQQQLTALRSLALVDLVDATAFSANTSRSGSRGSGSWAVLEWSALKSLLTADSSLAAGEASSPMKLVRAQPWNPAAYALAALRMYKRVVSKETSMMSSAAQSASALSSALRLLGTGLCVAQASTTTPPSATLLLHWTCALLHQYAGGEHEAVVQTHVDKALTILHDSSRSLSPVNKLLWEARVRSLVDRSNVVATYCEALALAKSSATDDQLVAILYELGGVCESFGLLDAAHHVWKTVANWKPLESETETETRRASVLNVPAFVGNLRLAIVHGTKNNAKAAKKFAKTAASLTVGASEEMHGIATTARFVETVFAKM